MPAVAGEDHGTTRPALAVLDFQGNPTPNSHPIVCVFLLPDVAENELIEDLLIRSDPAPGPKESSKYQVPFSIAPDNRLFVITLSFLTAQMSTTLFVPLSTFLPYLSRESEGVPLGCHSQQVDVPWEEWGSHGSRMDMLPLVGSGWAWPCYVHGSRFVCPHAAVHSSRHRFIDVFDFNPVPIRRLVQTADGVDDPDELDTNFQLVLEPVTISASEIPLFADNVTTHLPYRLMRSREKVLFDAVMLTEDNLVTVTVRESRYFFGLHATFHV